LVKRHGRSARARQRRSSELALRLAALDIGSNTVHITVARTIKQGTDIERLADERDLVRLGADVHAYGAIGPARMERVCETIRRQVALAHRHRAHTVLALATQAVRAATNGRKLIERVRHDTGVDIALVTGQQEAALMYWGAVSGLKRREERTAVIDMGGGSLELAFGTGTAIRWRTSLPLGSGTIHASCMPLDPPAAEEQLIAAERFVAGHLRTLPRPDAVDSAIVCGGTATALALLVGRLLPSDRELATAAGRGKSLARAQLEAALHWLACTPAAQVSALLCVDEGRARLLPAGAVILLAAMEWLGVEALRVRRRGVREGAMLTYACVGADWLEVATKGETLIPR
jgi:exopolyphosphatase / guanosine-5'-triphosphate,3'-diphosphate pyrophosphatase